MLLDESYHAPKGMVPVLKVAVSFMEDGHTAIMLCSKCCNRDACKMIGEPEKKEQLLEAEDICVSLEGTWKNLKVCPEQQIGVAQRSGDMCSLEKSLVCRQVMRLTDQCE